ncbi:MAG TPA: cell surface protein SprA [Saprospiraceae bacterium]|nr:cell surface protein SprA [Saprospiraceae bacterium]
MNKIFLPFSLVVAIIVAYTFRVQGGNANLNDPYARNYVAAVAAQQDTLPPLKDRYGDFINDGKKNPFDLKDPGVVEKNVEYDPVTNRYIITEKVGNDFFRPPTYMTFEEYMEYRRRQDESNYFKQLSGVSTGGGLSALDPIAKIDVQNSLLDRLFGGTNVNIQPQGNIDLSFGFSYQKVENPILPIRQQRQFIPMDFNMNIQMNVTGQIGEKLNLTTRYNTNATFNFDNQIKLDYNSANFSEDEILKKIEAGNVSLPLRGTLIQGAQSLFGLKTELQFGHLRLTTILSQQQSKRENIQIQGGSQLQEFEVRADEYDENRHFFFTHYNRDTYEDGLSNLPQIKSLFRVENIEVWLTNNRNEVDNVRDIIAFADLGEPRRLVSPNLVNPLATAPRDIAGRPLPDNRSNDLYQRVLADPNTRSIDRAVAALQDGFNMQQAKDFEKMSARRLQPTEYTIHPELGYISLNINVQPDQVVAVAFQYSYNGQTYKIGELSNNQEATSSDSSLNVLFVKMLKSTTQRTDIPTWDLMMKNVYSIGAFQVSQQDFRLDIFYDDPGKGQKRFLPESNIAGRPLLRIFNLDILNTQGDPQPDGIFDFVPGVTINLRNGRIMFPVLEPFGSALARQIDDDRSRRQFVYQELYDSTLFLAREFPEKNRFVIRGSYKSSVSSEISLGAFNIPPGSVRVNAGGQLLVEGADYEVDYNIGRVRILNDAILNSGVPINVSFEDNTLFGFQTKTMIGLRADYQIGENFNLGATYLQLFERPFTQKVNLGDDPINNRIYGLDINFSKDAPWLTKIVDAIPLVSTRQPSNITFSAEMAALKPGHARAINQNSGRRRDRDSELDEGGVVYIDDFEGSASSFDLRQPVNQWFLASTPQNDASNNNSLFPESALINDLRYGANRAKLNWYMIDQSIRSDRDRFNPYTGLVPQTEVFPNLQLTPDQLPNIFTFDLTYYPNERGPYNFEVPNGYPGYTRGLAQGDVNNPILLNDPKTRWGGIMRALQNNDFQAANIEFLEFWMLSPFLDEDDPLNPSDNFRQREGDLFINLGNVSEDILRDSRMFFENGLPAPTNPDRRVDQTTWSVIPVTRQITRAFDVDPRAREQQDVGLDGMNNDTEREKYRDYIEAIRNWNTAAGAIVEQDPANDDFRFYRDASFSPNAGVRERYRDFNNPEGNSQENQGGNFVTSATNIPDSEDINRDNSLNETESYFQYKVAIRADPANPREIDRNATPFITDRRVSEDGRRVWYRFRIPLNGPDKVSVGGIRDFRSIRFMRMYLKGFEEQTTLRFATLELVRNQWRRYLQDLNDIGTGIDECETPAAFDVDAVNIEENSGRQPFNYVLPKGIQRQQQLGVFNALQNEQSVSMVIRGLCDGDAKAIFKTVNMDMRVYERLRMFVHAEELDGMRIPDGELSIFIRLGSDIKENYYEYEIPLTMSRVERLTGNPNSDAYKLEVWRPENNFDIPLALLRDIKQERNELNIPLAEEYRQVGTDLEHIVKVRGNPNLGFIKIAMIGVRNRYTGDGAAYSAEVWANELRLNGLDERGGVAAIARMDMQLADFGSLTLAGNYSSIGFGALDQKVQQRSREQIHGYDVATRLELGKFFPESWGIRLPFFAQLSNQTRTPEFDPYDLDLILRDKIRNTDDATERDSIRQITRDVTNIRSYNFTNVRKERTGGSAGKPQPWDIENFSFSYAYTQTSRRDPLLEFDELNRYTGGFDYTFARQVKYIEPFKKIIKKDKYLKLLSELNFNPLPNSFSFRTILDRRFDRTRYRFTGLEDRFNTFYNKRFTWDRDYNVQWDITKALKFTFDAVNFAVIDEPDELAMAEDPTITDINRFRRDSIMTNLRNLGRTKNYRHNININYQLPIRYIPFMDWIQARASYQATYNWNAAALNVDSLGNVIQNNQNRQLNVDFNFDNLYSKSNYLKKIERPKTPPRPGTAPNQRPTLPNRGELENPDKKSSDKSKDKKPGEPSDLERALIRPLLLLRKARLTYNERFSTTLPGFTPQSELLGMSSGFNAPGWAFVAGLQPKIRQLAENEYGTNRDWLYQNRQWLSQSVFVNQQVIQEYSQNLDARLTIEPFRDFRIDVEATRVYQETHTEYFKVLETGADFSHTIPQQFGSMTVSFFAANTLFQDKQNQIRGMFKTFENNRSIVSQRLGIGEHDDPNLARQGFTRGYGRTQQDVLIPAFMAAYTDQNPQTIGVNIFDARPMPNWRLTYNGLAKVGFFKEIFQNFSLTHGYRSSLTVNRFNTGLDYLRTRDEGAINELNSNFYPRLEIPELIIQEGFQPLLAVNATMKNGMSLNVDFKKSRALAMSFISNQLSETRTEEISIGFGYIIRNLEIGFLGGNKNQRNRGRTQNQPPPQQGRPTGPGGGGQLQNRDLDIQFNFSLRDDVTFVHLLDQDTQEPTRGNYALTISPSAEYKLNRRLSLRLFFDYRRNVPKTSAGFPRTDMAGGVMVRFSLN